MNKRYLYGAAVQGIQQFIFQTSKLKDIMGASQLVDSICTSAFDEFSMSKDCEKIVSAAGNIKYIFQSQEDCEKAVRQFPQKVMKLAPGITISQAVVVMDGDTDFGVAIDALERKLRMQRNKPTIGITYSPMGVERYATTGLAMAQSYEEKDTYDPQEKEYTDLGTAAKRWALQKSKEDKSLLYKCYGEAPSEQALPQDTRDLTDSNDWIAIIHIDGNSLGQVVQRIGKDKDLFARFSQALDQSTIEAAHVAFRAVCPAGKQIKTLPIRPIVLGGDDLTVMIRADLALSYARAYLTAFEELTENNLRFIFDKFDIFNGQKKLTACGGIAYVKAKYPFFYAYELAENLCSAAKKDAKQPQHIQDGLAPSCMKFFKVQSSFVESLDKMVARTMQPNEALTFDFGPYYLHQTKDKWTIQELLEKVERLGTVGTQEENKQGVCSHIRHWLTLLHESTGKADQYKKRTLDIKGTDLIKTATDYYPKDTKAGTYRIPAFELLAIYTINNQKTK